MNAQFKSALTILLILTIAFGIVGLLLIPELFEEVTVLSRTLRILLAVAACAAMVPIVRSILKPAGRPILGGQNGDNDLTITDADWEERISQLQKREQALADRLTTYHGWQEFPTPIDLTRPNVELDDQELSELANKDREMLKLLNEEAESLFDRIQQNVYRPDGKLDTMRMRDDAMDLAQRVAKIYQPESERPLAETNIEQILRAASRTFMQLLVVTEQLPLNVQTYSLNDLYLYIQRGIKAYQVYKTVTPFWPYVNTAYYLGRLAMGANPLAMGAFWAIGTAGSRGAKLVASKLLNHAAVVALHQVIQVIGFEAANMYGGDFRYRDANWIYAAELSHLMTHGELTQKNLKAALKEIAALRLRNEYDRLYICRTIAEGKSAIPKRFRANATLTEEERLIVRDRLKKFARKFMLISDSVHSRWLKRLNYRFDVGDSSEKEVDLDDLSGTEF